MFKVTGRGLRDWSFGFRVVGFRLGGLRVERSGLRV